MNRYGLAADWKGARPDPADVERHYSAAIRRLSGERRGFVGGVDLSVPERDALLGAGLNIGLVWETTNTRRALEGRDAGTADAHSANNEADLLAAPITMAIYYAVGSDVDPLSVRAYFEGVVAAGRRRAGVFGGRRVIEGLVPAVVPYGWQSQRLSDRDLASSAHIYQRELRAQELEGVADGAYHENVLLAPDWGAWKAPDPTAYLYDDIDDAEMVIGG